MFEDANFITYREYLLKYIFRKINKTHKEEDYFHLDMMNFRDGKIAAYKEIRKEIKDVMFKSVKKSDKETKTYIIKDNNTNFYKIGKSKNPLKREKTLQSEKPTYKLIKIFDIDIEKELHNLYKKERVRGEWFKLTETQVKYICTKYK